MPHRLEKTLNAPADDILEAIACGFRAQADVKGKLAELYLARHLDGLIAQGVIDRYTWNDKDGVPDFEVFKGTVRLVVECKNVRSGPRHGGSGFATVELQKTRNGVDAQGNKTRGYRMDHFDVLAACTFNQTGQWTYRFIRSRRLLARTGSPDILVVMQQVPYVDGDGWSGDLSAVIEEELASRGGVGQSRGR